MKMPTCTVVVPVYKQLTRLERVILAHNAKLLQKYPFVIVGPSNRKSEKEEAQKLIMTVNVDVAIRSFPNEYFTGISGYNTLLKSRLFLDAFSNTDFILICQLDAIILSDELERWLLEGYDFVGPPHFKGYSTPEMPPRFIPGANGGLSLRNIAASRRALDKVRVVNKSTLSNLFVRSGLLKLLEVLFRHKPFLFTKASTNEDIFWSVLIPRVVSDYDVAPPHIAAKFAFEVLPRHLFEITGNTLPFGCHAWERYDREFWLTRLPSELTADLQHTLKDAS